MLKNFFYTLFIPTFIFMLTSGINMGCASNSYSHNTENKDNDSPAKVIDTVVIIMRDTIYLRDTVTITAKPEIIEKVKKEYITQVIPDEEMLDSVQTTYVLDNILSFGFITNSSNGQSMGTLYEEHLELLPYLYYLFSQDRTIPKGNYQYHQIFKDICTSKSKDPQLFEAGKRSLENINRKTPGYLGRYANRYPSEPIISPFYTPERISSNETDTNMDSLRVRVIAHNDRKALEQIERYYNKKNDSKGIAIYYKVLLCYEGNGDLAEKYYYVLRPYLADQPEFFNGIREVLLRAAMCDGNERAQELCDSLGISFCDYRLPLPE